MENNTSTPNGIPLSVDIGENGEITGWEMTLTRSQAENMLNKALYEATVQGDKKTAEIAKTVLGHIKRNSETDSDNTSEKK